LIKDTEINGLKFYYRPDTQDWNILQESCGGLYTKWFDVEPGEMWFDVGANIGGFTCYAASKGALVNAYEPIIDNYKLLVDNIILNGFDNIVLPGRIAVTKDGRPVTLYIDRFNFGNCGKYERGYFETTIVDSFEAALFNDYTEYCIKVDTEGFEYEILSSLDLSKVKKLLFENHYWLQPEKETQWLLDMWSNTFPNSVECGGYMFYAWR
jgi:FkbM family methyltransferase